jgi:acyl-CoA reductase-like NAD-dependent aldehyde dehydrogenase
MTDSPPPQAEQPPRVEHWIHGTATTGQGDETFRALNPDNDRVIAEVCAGTCDDVVAAVESSWRAFEDWRNFGPSVREALLLRAAELLQRQADEFCDLLIEEIGSPLAKARMEVGIASRVLRANAGMARRMTGRTYPSDVTERWSLAVRRPLGVVASITPFNVPLIKGVKHASMPLATGNTVTWLPSMHTPRIADRVARLFHEAGAPPGGLNVVHGRGEVIGDALVGHPAVRAVSFTGSAAVGRQVQATCGRLGKRVTLELGGKNPLIVLGDADLNEAVRAAVRGGFIYQGQICMASSRVLVEASLFDAFIEAFTRASEALKAGPLHEPDTMIGPIISPGARQTVRSHLDDAIEKGATVCCGNAWNGNRLNPTVVFGVTESMTMFHEETFGPVVSVERVRDASHAIERANAVPGMLSAAVFTADLAAAMRVANEIESGMVHVNDMTIQQEPEVPFGSDGGSGFGREGMQTGIDDFTTWKWITMRSPTT